MHLSGFPSDASQRELINFCKFLPGLVQATGKPGQRPVAFARFQTREDAMEAISRVDGSTFDEHEPEIVIRASIAKRNLVPFTHQRRSGSSSSRPSPRGYPIKQQTDSQTDTDLDKTISSSLIPLYLSFFSVSPKNKQHQVTNCLDLTY